MQTHHFQHSTRIDHENPLSSTNITISQEVYPVFLGVHTSFLYPEFYMLTYLSPTLA